MVRFAADPDPHAGSKRASRMTGRRKPQRTFDTKIDAVELAVDRQRRREAARPTRQVAHLVRAARRCCISAIPSSGSSARIRMPAPTPAGSLLTLKQLQEPYAM